MKQDVESGTSARTACQEEVSSTRGRMGQAQGGEQRLGTGSTTNLVQRDMLAMAILTLLCAPTHALRSGALNLRREDLTLALQ